MQGIEDRSSSGALRTVWVKHRHPGTRSDGGGLMADQKIVAGLDIGTTKITAIVAEADENGDGIRIIGVGSPPSDGAKRGEVGHLAKTTRPPPDPAQGGARMREPLASGDAVLPRDEGDLGVGLFDMGGGTTDVAIFYEGSVRHTAVIGLGGSNVTNDLAIGLRTPVERAEQLKLQSGCALTSMVSPKEVVQVPSVGGRLDREVSRHMLAMMIEPRIEEIFELGKKEIRKNHVGDLLGAGVVLTGGASNLAGMPELAEQVFDLPVRRGLPMGITGLTEAVCDPRFATGVGLAIHAPRVGG